MLEAIRALDMSGNIISTGDYVLSGEDIGIVTGFTPSKSVILDLLIEVNGKRAKLRSYTQSYLLRVIGKCE